MKKLLIILLFIIFSSNVYADSKFDKDLKKVSKLNGFTDSFGTIYPADQISNKENTILIIYNHGSTVDWKLDKCSSAWNKIPPAILQLHDQKIKNLQIKLYQLCSGVKGWTENERSKMWEAHKKSGKLSYELADRNGTPLIKKQKQLFKQKIINNKIDDFTKQGFNNIVLVGHSAGAWASITLKSQFPEKIDGVIAFHPAVSGTFKNRKDWPWWEDVRTQLIGLMKLENLKNALVFAHNKDHYETPKSLSFLSNLKSIKFVDISGLDCKGEAKLGRGHAITLTKCFAEKDNNIVPYLEEIF
jgi:hypothetical protein